MAPSRRSLHLPRPLSVPIARLLLLLLLAFASTLNPSLSVAGTLRGGGSWGWDSNVFENMDANERVQDSFIRFLVEAVPKPQRIGQQAIGMRLRGMTEHYAHQASDSRYQIEGGLEGSRRVRRTAVLWISGRGEYRTYPDSTVRNYHRGNAALGVNAKARGGDLNVAWALRGLDYRRTERFDRRANALTIDYRRSLHPRLEIGATTEFEWSRYGRDVLRSAQEGLPLVDTTKVQRDRGREARLSLQYMRGWLFETFLAWESIRSNSFGSSVGRRSIGGMVSGWLPGQVLLQIRGRAEWTSYRDHDLSDVFISRPGEEQEAGEDNNSLQVRVRRPLAKEWSIEGRLSWFRNESLLVGSYYPKSLGSIGVVWTPIGASDF